MVALEQQARRATHFCLLRLRAAAAGAMLPLTSACSLQQPRLLLQAPQPAARSPATTSGCSANCQAMVLKSSSSMEKCRMATTKDSSVAPARRGGVRRTNLR